MNINKININQSEPTYYIASDIYDVSAHNDDVTFESLSALLGSDNLSTLIPTAIRCGGMTIRFVQSSDNKYVQYRLMSNVWSTNVANWQGVDEEVIPGSVNLVEARGIAAQDFALGAHFTGSGDVSNVFVRFSYLGYKAGDIVICNLLSDEAKTPNIDVYEIYTDGTYSLLGTLKVIGLKKSFEITRDDVYQVMFSSYGQDKVPFSVEIYKNT